MLEGLLTDLGQVLVDKGYTTGVSVDAELKSMIVVKEASVDQIEFDISNGIYVIIPSEEEEVVEQN